MLGREVRAPIDIVYGTPAEQAPATFDNYASELEDRLRRAYCLVRENLKVAAERSKKYYDLRVKSQQYRVGDWVYYFNPRRRAGRQDKWCRKFSGPYLVVKVLGPVNVLLQRSKRTKPFSTHIDKVKPYTAAATPRSWLNSDSTNTNESTTATEAISAESADVLPEVLVDTSPAQQDNTPAKAEEADDSVLTAIAGVPPVNLQEPRPKRSAGRPRRYDD